MRQVKSWKTTVLENDEIGSLVKSAISDIRDIFANIANFESLNTRLDQTRKALQSLKDLGK